MKYYGNLFLCHIYNFTSVLGMSSFALEHLYMVLKKVIKIYRNKSIKMCPLKNSLKCVQFSYCIYLFF